MDKKIRNLTIGVAMVFSMPLVGVAEMTTGPTMPVAILESHSKNQDILPTQYASYSTMMKIVVTDYDVGFGFILPWRVADGVMINMDVRSESEHIEGYSFHLTGPQVDENYSLSFTKRNNTPPVGTSQKLWNSTWYDVPIKGMTNTEYVDIWRKHSDLDEKNNISGGFFEHKGATSARWSRIVPKDSTNGNDTTLFEVEFIMSQDPTHRYNLAIGYPSSGQTFVEQGILGTIAPSFYLVNKKNYREIGDITVADGISFVKPVGFTRIKESGKIAFEKGGIRLDVESVAMPQRMNIGAPTLAGKQILGDLYVANLVSVNHATIEQYESHIINGQVSFFVAGQMNNPQNISDQGNSLQPETIPRKVAFAATIILGNQGNVGIARVLAPVGTNLTSPDVVAALDGMRISDGSQNGKSTIIL